ncbi:MAG TPA: MFS transporter, partial [Methylomirabilota bacterium]|nr:MFS transporter [Methylomirabilota bacterium]
LVLPPLFPVLRREFGVGYAALGLMMGVFYAASGIGQPTSGFLVDHVGARRVLLGGMGLLTAGIALAALSPSYWLMFPILMVAGLGNSVFHPADYAIVNASVDRDRVGRAYGIHSICGSLGWAAAPPVVVGLSALAGWRTALAVAGIGGLLVTLVLTTQRHALADHRPALLARRPAGAGGLAADVRLLLVPPILLAFAYFTLLAMAIVGIQTFSVAALVAIYDVPLGLASGTLTGYLLGSAVGILAGGFLADRTLRHDRVAAGGMLLAAGLTLAIGSGGVPVTGLLALTTLAGLCVGATSPSRDMLVRAATPPGASGKVYGFVYSGLDLGSTTMPFVFGWLLDRGEPRLCFVLVAVIMLLAIFTVVEVRRHAVRVAPI